MATTFDEHQRPRLERLFVGTVAYLGVLIGLCLWLAARLTDREPQSGLLLLVIVSGIAGSATAAMVSSLDRHANGLEDSHGVGDPEPDVRKERFSERMFYWFLARPWLGAVVGLLIFWGITSGAIGDTTAELSGRRVAFYGLLSGLFAKTILDLLRNLPKAVFRL